LTPTSSWNIRRKNEILPKIKEMLPVDDIMFQRDLLPQHSSKLDELALQKQAKSRSW
jgi:hypothetical protein